MKKRRYILTAGAAMAVIAAVTAGVWRHQTHFELAVGGQEITKETYLQVMNTEIAGVTSYFAQKGADKVNEDFWTEEIGGEIPYEVLADRTIDRLKYLAAAYDTAGEYGYLESSGLTNIWERMEEENAARKAQDEAGEPVYGLLEFSINTFMEYDLDRLQKAYCQKTDNPGMDITDEEREAYYEENKDRLFREGDDIDLEYLKIDCLNMTEEEKETWKEKLTAIYKMTDSEHTLAKAAEKYPEAAGRAERLELSSAEAGAYYRTAGDILEYAEELKEGESTPVIDENGALYLIQCTGRTEHEYQTLEEAGDNINKILREEKYEEMLREKAESENVSEDVKTIYSFTRRNI